MTIKEKHKAGDIDKSEYRACYRAAEELRALGFGSVNAILESHEDLEDIKNSIEAYKK